MEDVIKKVDKKVEVMEQKLDKIMEMFHNLDKKIDRIESSLKVTKAKTLELEQEIKTEIVQIRTDLKPIQRHVDVVTTVMKIAAWLIGSGSLTTLVYMIAKK